MTPEWIVLCHKAEAVDGGMNLSIAGVRVVTASSIPIVVPLCFAFSLRLEDSDIGTHEVETRLRYMDDEARLVYKQPLTIAPIHRHYFGIVPLDVRFHAQGLFHVEFLIDRKSLQVCPVRVEKRGGSGDRAGQPVPSERVPKTAQV